MAEEREVVARLRIEKEGDEGAFKEAAADIRELGSAAAENEGLGNLAEKERDAAGGAKELATETRAAGTSAATAAPQVERLGEGAAGAGDKLKGAAQGVLDFKERLALSLPAIASTLQAVNGLEGALNELAQAVGIEDKITLPRNAFDAFRLAIEKTLELIPRAKEAFAAFQNAPGGLAEKLTAADEAMRGFNSETEKIRDQIRGINEEISKEAEGWVKAIASLERAGGVHDAEVARILSGLEKMAEKAEKAGVDLPQVFDDYLAKYRELGDASEKRGQEATTEASAVEQGAARQQRAHQTVTEASNEQTQKSRELAQAVQQSSAAAAATTTVWDAQTRTLKNVAQAAGEAGDRIKEGAGKAGEGATDLAGTGEAGKAAGEGMKGAATAATELGGAAESSKTGVANLKGEFGGFSAVIDPLKTALESIKTVFDGLNQLSLAAMVAQLKAVEIAALAAARAVASIDGDGGLAPDLGDGASGTEGRS